MEHEYNTVEEALEDLKQGKIVLVTDDENRENEGDMICAAEFATQENINFMASYAKGLICTPMSVELAEKLGFVPMVTKNTDNHETAFTVSIDYARLSTTGISAAERGLTMRMCVDENVSARGFQKAGACISADCEKRRCAGEKWTYRSNCRFDASCRVKTMRCVL